MALLFAGYATGAGVAHGQAVTATPTVTASQTPSPTAAPCERVHVGPPTLPAGSVGVAYRQAIFADRYLFYSWSVSPLPPGLRFGEVNQGFYNSALLSGTPTTAGTFTFTVTARYGRCTAEGVYNLLIGPPPTPTPARAAFPRVNSSRTPRVVPFLPSITQESPVLSGAVLGVSAQAATVNWVPVGPPGSPAITAMAVAKPDYTAPFPQLPSPLFAATMGSGVFRSGDAGGTWTGTGPGLPGGAAALAVRQIFHMGVDVGTYDTTVFAGTSGAGIFRLPPGAASWVASNTSLTSLDVRALAVSGDGVVRTGNTGVVFAGTSDGLFASADDGNTWVRKSLGLPSNPSATITALATDPSSPATLYAGTSGGLFKSVDTGETWSPLDTVSGYILSVSAVAVDPLLPTRLYAAGVKTLPCNPFCLPIAFMPVTLRSLDGGGTWFETDGPPFNLVSGFAATPTLPSRVFAATSGGGVFESDDAGVTWSPASDGLDIASITSLVIDPSLPSLIFAGTAQGVFSAPLGQVSAGCPPNVPTVLCLDSNRFSAQVRWTATKLGQTGFGQAIPLTSQTGAFWFFQPSNIELVIKVLDARAINGKFWVFYGSLTNVQFTLTVTDQQTGEVRTYFNPEGQLASFADTSAF